MGREKKARRAADVINDITHFQQLFYDTETDQTRVSERTKNEERSWGWLMADGC